MGKFINYFFSSIIIFSKNEKQKTISTRIKNTRRKKHLESSVRVFDPRVIYFCGISVSVGALTFKIFF